MKVELLKNLQGENLWKKGIYDDSISPIPRDIMQEVAQKGSRLVRVFPEPKAELRKEVEPEIKKDEQESGILDGLTSGMSENFQIDTEGEDSTGEMLSEENKSPEAATEDKIVEAETDNASFLTKEKPTKHLPELEGLIHAKGTIAAVSNLLHVSYGTVNRWRKGGSPKPEMLTKIKKEYDKLMRLGNDQDRIDDIASAGIKEFNVET